MFIKKLNFNNYNEIRRLILRNGLKVPTYRFWKKLWNDNEKKVGEGVFNNNKLVGYHSFFKKKIRFKKKFYNILVSSNWNVDKKYRNTSIVLLNRFFKENCDFYITTTANKIVANIWKSYGAIEINNLGCKRVIFKILNIKNFLKVFFIKKNIKLPFIVMSIISFFFKIYLLLFKNNKINKTLNYYPSSLNLNKINDFNKYFENNSINPHEIRTNSNFSNYIKAISYNKKIYTIIFKEKDLMIGYAILICEKLYNTKIKRMYLGQIRLLNNKYKYINEIFEYLSIYSKKKDCALIEFRNLNKNLIKKLRFDNFFIRFLKNNPYLLKFNNKNKNDIKRFFKNNLDTSYLDGDCLL